MPWQRVVHAIAWPFFRVYSRITRGVTLGVRGLVIDGEGQVLLVEHTYMAGWYLPGGGVERGETAETAVIRELEEEAGVRVIGRPALISLHSNHRVFRGDHVAVYRIDHWTPCAATSHGEIARVGWFDPHALPEQVTPGTRRRIEEAFKSAIVTPHW